MIRLAGISDVDRLADWIFSTPHNNLDPCVAGYQHLNIFTVEKDGEPILYAPTHPVLQIESVAVKPGITPRQYIEALLEMKAATESFARQYKMGEIVTSSAYQPIVKTLCRHGYSPIVGTALRKRIA